MKDKTFLGASVLAAIVASFCCILPIVLALTGVTVLGAAAAFSEWRPHLLALTFGFLGLGFYFAYRPAQEPCGPGSACARPGARRSSRLLVWLATAVVIAFAAFPYYSAPVAELLLSSGKTEAVRLAQEGPGLQHVSLAIQGMDCPACATAIENKLKAVPGVRQAGVSYERSRAEIDYLPGSVSPKQLEKTIQEAGYGTHKAEQRESTK